LRVFPDTNLLYAAPATRGLLMKALIAAAVAAAFALPAFAQQNTPPTAQERAQNREKVSKGASNKGKVDSGEAKKKAGETRRRSTA
jgi:uncharacterized membrane protein